MRRGKARTWIRGIAGGVVLVASATALGQPTGKDGGAAPASSAQAGGDLQAHYGAGLEWLKKKEWAKAGEELSLVYRAKPTAQIAINLAEAEIHLGHYRDAAEHLEKYLREEDPKQISASDKKSAEGWLKQARQHIASVKLKVALEGSPASAGGLPPGAEVLLDDIPLNLSPFPPEIFLEPGKHTITARTASARDQNWGEFTKGSVQEVSLVLKPVAGPTSTATASATGSTGPGTPGKPFPVRTAVLAAGGAVAAIGVGAGIAGLVLMGSKRSERDGVCTLATCLHVGDPGYQGQKDAWVKLDNERRSMTDLAIAGMVVGGLALVGTGVVFFVLKPADRKSEVVKSLSVVPLGTGLAVSGQW